MKFYTCALLFGIAVHGRGMSIALTNAIKSAFESVKTTTEFSPESFKALANKLNQSPYNYWTAINDYYLSLVEARKQVFFNQVIDYAGVGKAVKTVENARKALLDSVKGKMVSWNPAEKRDNVVKVTDFPPGTRFLTQLAATKKSDTIPNRITFTLSDDYNIISWELK